MTSICVHKYQSKNEKRNICHVRVISAFQYMIELEKHQFHECNSLINILMGELNSGNDDVASQFELKRHKTLDTHLRWLLWCISNKLYRKIHKVTSSAWINAFVEGTNIFNSCHLKWGNEFSDFSTSFSFILFGLFVS